MPVTTQTGVYGKLPANGDFLMRNLPSGFVNSWDQWLQQFMSSTGECIGQEWLDIYLTSPIWRFVLSSGVDDVLCGWVRPLWSSTSCMSVNVPPMSIAIRTGPLMGAVILNSVRW